MKVNNNGVIRNMTEDEILEMQRAQAQIPVEIADPETRLDEIEAAMMELAALIVGGGAE